MLPGNLPAAKQAMNNSRLFPPFIMNLNDSDHFVYTTLTHAAATWPDQLAIADEYGQLTYRQLYEQTELLKNYLRLAKRHFRKQELH